MVVQGTEGQRTIIPCKPTSKYVQVELIMAGEDEVSFSRYIIAFHPFALLSSLKF